MDKLNLSTTDIISLVVWLVVLSGVVHWGHSFRKHVRDILGYRKAYYCFSGVLILIAAFGLFYRGLNWGLDFTGGTVVEIGSPQVLTVGSADVAQILENDNPGVDFSVQLGEGLEPFGNEGKAFQKILVRAKGEQGKPVELQSDQVTAIVADLQTKLNAGTLEKLSETSIGPTVSGELIRGAILALVVVMFCQLLYITLRFGNQLRYGIAADIAVAHDSFIMIGIYALSGMSVDSSFVAAFLTVAGYSVMDTVVIFDRIREHNRNDVGDEFPVLCNRSVNETMTRSVNTTLTTIVVCIALYFFGGITLKGFAFALLVGITLGAYSSIFLAAPLLVELDILAKKRDLQRAEEMRLAAAERAASSGKSSKGTGSARKTNYPKPSELPAASADGDEEDGASKSAAPATSAAPSLRTRRRIKGMRRG